MNSFRLILSLSILTPGLVWTVFDARAQTCTQAPSCSELGFTSSVSDCVGSDMVKCPFDSAKVFCRQTKSCAELGYDKTTSQCSGKKIFVCPGDTSKVACDDSAMVGEIKLWPTATIPKGWRLCDGTSLPSSTYSKLYAVIGTTYGGSNSYFSLPKLSGRVPVGVGYATQYTYKLAETGGQNFVQLSSDQIPDHKHIIPWGEKHTSNDYNPWGTWGSGKYGSGDSDGDNVWRISAYMYGRSGYRSYPSSITSGWGSSGSCSNDRASPCTTTSHENRMPYLALNYIIYTGVY